MVLKKDKLREKSFLSFKIPLITLILTSHFSGSSKLRQRFIQALALKFCLRHDITEILLTSCFL